MRVSLVAIGTKMPEWVNTAFNEYKNRLPKTFSIELIEIIAKKRTKQADLSRITEEESEALLKVTPKDSKIIALDRQGQSLSTVDLAKKLIEYRDTSQSISLLIGGPEGISEKVLKKADQRWSLSKLTLPHPIVRVIIAEQLFRAWSIMTNHPYHR